MSKFARIENLMGREVEKIPLPPELGPGPKYEPEGPKKSDNLKRVRKGNNRFRKR
jgi:hypothetical protein